MKAAPVKADCESLGNEFMNGVFFSAQRHQVGKSTNGTAKNGAAKELVLQASRFSFRVGVQQIFSRA